MKGNKNMSKFIFYENYIINTDEISHVKYSEYSKKPLEYRIEFTMKSDYSFEVYSKDIESLKEILNNHQLYA